MVRHGNALVFDQARKTQHDAAIAPKVPATAPMAAARKAMRIKGIKDAQVKTIINNSAMTPEQKEDALIDWEYQPFIRRNSPLVAAFGPALGLTEAQIDDLFFTAQTL